jgi:uncharacterized delta-60 repeat protein
MKNLFHCIVLLLSFGLGIAQNAADVDTSFGPLPGFNGIIKATAQQPDGKILVGGTFTKYKDLDCKYFVRLLPDGNVDPSFTIENNFWYGVTTILLQPDGKIVVGGGYYTPVNGPKVGVTRLNSDGSTDYTFNTMEKFVGVVLLNDMVLQPDGKLILIGGFSAYDSVSRNGIVRINTDGSLDSTFAPGSGFNGSCNSVALQPDGKMIVAGSFTNYNGYTRNHIIRLNSDATVDLTFSIGVGFDGNGINSVVLQPDGKIVAAGSFYNYKNVAQNGIIRLLTNGDKDTSFNVGTGLIYYDTSINTRDMVIDSSGSIYLGGSITSYNGVNKNYIIKINSNGSLDDSFTLSDASLVYSILIQDDQKILLGGNLFVSRVNNLGIIQNTFDFGTGFNNDILSTILQPDGKILVGGNFTKYKLLPENGLIRLNTDGTKDNIFSTSYLNYCKVQAMILQPDGKIIVRGTFRYTNSSNFFFRMRLNADGSQDTTFDFTYLPDFKGSAIQQDGKILIFWSNSIRRLSSNGSYDSTFNTGTGFNYDINSIALQPDGKIIVVGAFTTFNGEPHQRIVRLLSNGSVDPSFNTGEGFNSSAKTIRLQPDGKIIVGGDYGSYNVISSWGITRINIDGSYDPTFNPGFNINNVNSIVIESDGKIVAGGYNSTFAGNPLKNLVRFNTDGSVDSSFDIGTGFDPGSSSDFVSTLLLQPNGKILIHGNFNNYKATSSFNLVRINGGVSALSTDSPELEKTVIYPNPTHDYLSLKLPYGYSNYDYQITDLSGKIVLKNTSADSTIDVQSLSKGIYLLQIKRNKETYHTKFIKE